MIAVGCYASLPMRVEDVVYHLKLLEAPEMFKLFEQQIASQIKLIRSKGVPRHIEEW